MSATGTGGGLLLVHAHPDDESIGTGATMARYAAEGTAVTLVTCTLGELGEVIPAELTHLAAGSGDRLGEYRIGELAAACDALGVKDHRFLGGASRWRDSGMMGLPDNDAPGCFWQADVDEAARELVAIIREVRPQVMVSYDDNGFYGHPDHIQAHRVAWRAFRLAADPALPAVPGPAASAARGTAGPWQAAKFYATAMPRSALAEAIILTGDGEPAPPAGFTAVSSVDELPFGTADEQVTTEIDGTGYLDAKAAALRAHATQIAVHPPFFALSNGIGRRIMGREYFTLLAGELGPAAPGGREADLFAGLG
ncbi:MAG TPA: N-acetyl-1-D-myo-inositol-2-amino-2-deoxy-alpha-D-glucopyranoside deacetylase [Streptosporangiaceae bacterium]|nr:N-acetyl-1-D-myo-inositol-2-amino-2-deoxy-alpha-D-glucopyranoside deacetylase [Streptosporangiaceae bacterium]